MRSEDLRCRWLGLVPGETERSRYSWRVAVNTMKKDSRPSHYPWHNTPPLNSVKTQDRTPEINTAEAAILDAIAGPTFSDLEETVDDSNAHAPAASPAAAASPEDMGSEEA